MKQIGLFSILLLLLYSCDKGSQPDKPDYLISKYKMEQILFDLYTINAAKGVNKKLMESQGLVPETYILNKYAIDSAQFASSNSYYAHTPEIYKAIVENVKRRLEKKKNEFEAIEKKEGDRAQRRRDSVSELNKKNKDSVLQGLKNNIKESQGL